MGVPQPNPPQASPFWQQPFPSNMREWQASHMVHPYTCPNRGDGQHVDNGRDLGVLTVIDDTHLICDSCGYEQFWTHFGRAAGGVVGETEPADPEAAT